MPDLLRTWRRLARWPGGRWIFSRVLGRIAPYTGSIRARVLTLERGFARVALTDRRALRNHLGSIHAIALANLGEVTSGIAMLSALAPGVRGIVTHLSVEYLKKARGRLVAEARTAPPSTVTDSVDIDIAAEIRDAAGDVVARVSVRWRLGPA